MLESTRQEEVPEVKIDDIRTPWGWVHKYVDQDENGNDVTRFVINQLKPSLMDPPPNDYYKHKNAAGQELKASIEDIEKIGLPRLGASDDKRWAIWLKVPGGATTKRWYKINHNDSDTSYDPRYDLRCPAAGFYGSLADIAGNDKLTYLFQNKTCNP